MSFSRVNPGGWSVGSILTSAQQNQLDTNVSIALDKSAAGDQFEGLLTFNGGQIQANQTTAIASKIASGISVDVASGMRTTAAGAIILNGGGTDEIQYGTSRIVQQAMAMTPLTGVLNTGWTGIGGLPAIFGPATTAAQPIGALIVHNGATLTNVRVYITVATHTGLPAVMPKAQVWRYNLTTATAEKLADVSASAASYTAWNATTYWDVAVSVDNVIDRTQYIYYVVLVDESGTNSVSGNAYNGMVLTMGSITSMAFG